MARCGFKELHTHARFRQGFMKNAGEAGAELLQARIKKGSFYGLFLVFSAEQYSRTKIKGIHKSMGGEWDFYVGICLLCAFVFPCVFHLCPS